MADFEEFQAALASDKGSRDSEGEPTFMNSLMNSMCLVLDEFYKNLTVGILFVLFHNNSSLQLSSQAVGVSSVTGDGFDGFLAAVEASRKEYDKYAASLPLQLVR